MSKVNWIFVPTSVRQTIINSNYGRLCQAYVSRRFRINLFGKLYKSVSDHRAAAAVSVACASTVDKRFERVLLLPKRALAKIGQESIPVVKNRRLTDATRVRVVRIINQLTGIDANADCLPGQRARRKPSARGVGKRRDTVGHGARRLDVTNSKTVAIVL